MVKKLKILFFGIGISLFIFLVYKIGVTEIYDNLLSMGYKFPLIFIPFFLICFFDTVGWKYSFSSWFDGIKLRNLYPVRWAGESINILTPTAYVGGEPIKAYILKRYNVPFHDGLASVIVGKTVMTMAQIFFLILGIGATAFYISSDNYLILSALIVLVISIPLVWFFYLWQKRGLFSSIYNLLQKLKIRINYILKNKDKIELLDEKIRHFYKKKKENFFLSFFYYFLGWSAGLFEVYTILYLMGYNIGFSKALIIESMVQLLKSCSFFIPGSLGVVEGGGLLIFTSLGFDAQTGLSYGIFRRSRELIWAGAGLLILMSYGVKKAQLDEKKLINNK